MFKFSICVRQPFLINKLHYVVIRFAVVVAEEKLNKTIDLLHQLSDSVVENRAVAYAVGDTICGRQKFEEYVDGAKKLWKTAKDGVDKVNETLGIGVAVTKGINEITKLFTGEEDE